LVKKGCKKFGKGKKVATFAPALSKCSVTDWYRRKRLKGPDKTLRKKDLRGWKRGIIFALPELKDSSKNHKILESLARK